MTEIPRLVTSTDGVRLAVYETGEPSAPTVLAVHGYPDNHTVWDGVAALLSADYRVVTYDVRGAGESDKPGARSAYRITQLVDDLAAVLDAVSPDRPVHLLAHDWGSIQAWHAVTDPRAATRIASFTTISGPCLDHTAYWVRERLRRPTPRRLAALARQGAKSWYIAAFHLPLLAGLTWRWWLGGRWAALLRRTEGVEPRPGHPQPTLVADAVRGLALYRANMLPRLLRPEPRFAVVPVQLISPLTDRFVSPALAEGLERWAPDLRRHTLPCGHWGALTTAAASTAGLIGRFVAQVEADRQRAAA
jgi:pimeloyl-ACP methyl ester carboxylesterase